MAHVTVRDLIEHFDADLSEAIVVADMEAGLEHLSWAGGTLRHVDLLLVVVEANTKVLMTAGRIVALARELGIPTTALVANRARPGDRQRLQEFADEQGCELLGVVPDDDALRQADRVGVCPLDAAPGSPAVEAIADLASLLESRAGPGVNMAANG
ncbi:MAG: ATP-binding protein [Acidimicrobiales bacterium]